MFLLLNKNYIKGIASNNVSMRVYFKSMMAIRILYQLT